MKPSETTSVFGLGTIGGGHVATLNDGGTYPRRIAWFHLCCGRAKPSQAVIFVCQRGETQKRKQKTEQKKKTDKRQWLSQFETDLSQIFPAGWNQANLSIPTSTPLLPNSYVPDVSKLGRVSQPDCNKLTDNIYFFVFVWTRCCTELCTRNTAFASRSYGRSRL